MDKSTRDIRLANWLNIIKQCQERPSNVSARQWLSENNVDEKQYYYWLRKVRTETYDQMQLPAVAPSAEVSFAEVSYSADKFNPTSFHTVAGQADVSSNAAAVIRCNAFSIELSNDISDSLLTRLLQEVCHA